METLYKEHTSQGYVCMKEASLLSIQVGLPKTIVRTEKTDIIDKPWTSGIFKTAVSGKVWLSKLNLDGDAQANLKAHGGPHRAVNVYPSEHYLYWKQDLHLSDMPYGGFGENFTTQGLLEDEVCIGDVFKVGNAIVQVSQPRQPCRNLSRRWQIKDLPQRVRCTGKIGWYLRVLQEGYVESGNDLILIERLFPQWTVAKANLIMQYRRTNFLAAQTLSRCPALSPDWKKNLSIAKQFSELICFWDYRLWVKVFKYVMER